MRLHRSAAAAVYCLALGAAAAPARAASGREVAKLDAGAKKIRVQVRDPLYAMTAGTLEIPAGWKFAGTVARGGGCASTGPALKYTAQSPDGLTAVEAYPGFAWSWSADPRFSQLVAKTGCAVSPSMSAREFLERTAIPNLRPGAQLLGIDPPSAKWQARIDQRLATMNARTQQLAGRVRGFQAQNRLEGALARIRTALHGQPVDEELATLVQCSITQGGMPGRPVEKHQCSALYLGVRRAPAGRMEETRSALEALVDSYQPDPAWSERMAQDAQKAAQGAIDASNAATQQIARNGDAQRASQQRIHDQQMAVTQRGTSMAMQRDREAQAATDTAAKRQAQISLGRRTYADPRTGEKVETTDQYGHVFRSADGSTVLHTDDPTYDPNGRDNQIWTELTPVDP